MTESGSNEKIESIKTAIFLHCIGDEALTVYNTFEFELEEAWTLDAVKSRFDKYCTPRKNVVFERYIFGQCIQNSGESLDQFVTNLRLKARSCELKIRNIKSDFCVNQNSAYKKR